MSWLRAWIGTTGKNMTDHHQINMFGRFGLPNGLATAISINLNISPGEDTTRLLRQALVLSVDGEIQTHQTLNEIIQLLK